MGSGIGILPLADKAEAQQPRRSWGTRWGTKRGTRWELSLAGSLYFSTDQGSLESLPFGGLGSPLPFFNQIPSL